MAKEEESGGQYVRDSQNLVVMKSLDARSLNNGGLPIPDLSGLSISASGEVIQSPQASTTPAASANPSGNATSSGNGTD